MYGAGRRHGLGMYGASSRLGLGMYGASARFGLGMTAAPDDGGVVYQDSDLPTLPDDLVKYTGLLDSTDITPQVVDTSGGSFGDAVVYAPPETVAQPQVLPTLNVNVAPAPASSSSLLMYLALGALVYVGVKAIR